MWIVLKGALSDFCQTMLIFESTKTNRASPLFEIPPPTHTHVRTQPWQWWSQRWHTRLSKQKLTQISCVKQYKINVTHRSRRNNATSAFVLNPCRSLISLQRWKEALIFAQDLPLASWSLFSNRDFSDILGNDFNDWLLIQCLICKYLKRLCLGKSNNSDNWRKLANIQLT